MPVFIDTVICSTSPNTTSPAIVWEALEFSVLSLTKAINPPDFISILASGGLMGYGFDGVNSLEQIFGSLEIPHNWREGTSLYPHLDWMPTTTGTGNVEWTGEFVWHNSYDATVAIPPPSSLSAFTATTGVAWLPYHTVFPAIDGTGMKIGSHVMFRIYRNPLSTNDTYAADAVLMTGGLHYQVNSMGSRQIHTK